MPRLKPNRSIFFAIIRLDHVNFITHNPEATVDFYCQVIGLTLGKELSIDTSQSLYFYIGLWGAAEPPNHLRLKIRSNPSLYGVLGLGLKIVRQSAEIS